MPLQSSLPISWGKQPARAEFPQHAPAQRPERGPFSAHSPPHFSLPVPGPGHTSLCSAVGGEEAPSARRKGRDSQVCPWGRPQGLPEGGMTAEPSWWGRRDPQQGCIPGGLRSSRPQWSEAVPRRVQHLQGSPFFLRQPALAGRLTHAQTHEPEQALSPRSPDTPENV